MGTLGFSNIESHADYEVEHQSVGMSSGGPIGSQMLGNMASTMLAGINGGGSASSTTKAAVSEGTIVIRDKESQQQNVNDLSRDVANANPGLEKIFDKEKEQRRVETVQAVVDIGLQVSDIVRTEGRIAGEKAKLDPQKMATAKAQLEEKARQNNVKTAPGYEDIAQQAYNNAMAPWGTGSAIQQGISAATAAASALAGASSGAAGEYIAQQLYPGVDRKDLSEEQRQTISTLGTLAAGLAGGLAGDSAGSAVAGAQAGKNAVENNDLFLYVNPNAYQDEFKKTGDPLYRLTEKYEQEVREHAEAGDPLAIQELHKLEEAKENARIAVAAYGTVAAGVVAPEVIAAARAAASGCAENPVLCVNEVGAWIADMIAGDAAPAGLTVATVSKMTVTELSELKALMTVEKQTGTTVSTETVSQLVKTSDNAASELRLVDINSGGKGGWSKELNNPQPNTLYKVDGDKVYKTDNLARPIQVEATLSPSVKDRNTYQQCKAGKCGVAGDEGGHLIASIFNGPGEKLNLLPMNGNLNKGAWKQMENTWAKALSEGKEVKVNIQPSYVGDSVRPDKFYVEYTIDGGRPIEETFKNAPGGK